MQMYQKDLLWDLDKAFVEKIINIAEKESHQKGDVLFREGDDASHFYILTKGHVRLNTGKTGSSVYIINHPGEVFGWSSVVGMEKYSATAECVEATSLSKINGRELAALLDKDPANGMIFFKKISGALGNRLLHIYQFVSPAEDAVSYGTGQVQDTAEPV
jgi:CRP-like cAMP-binding protein